MKNLLPVLPVAALLCAACSAKDAEIKSRLNDALAGITSEQLLKHIRVLSSDEFEGRAPGTSGEKKTVSYVADQFRKVGLKPGNPDGTYLQRVPMAGFKSHATGYFAAPEGRRIELAFPHDFVAVSRRFQPVVRVAGAGVVFVGYGVVAPEYGWDDFKGVDVTGKVLVMLINDPPVPDPGDPSRLDGKMFKGKEMTYYGRWTYKYEIAAEKGAAAAIIVHETGPAGYPYAVVVGSWGRENFDLDTPEAGSKRPAVEGWITRETAEKLFSLAGRNFEALKKSALSRDFRPVSLGVVADFSIENGLRRIQSNNVVGRLEGSDPMLKNEYVVYSAHWDHLGRDASLKGDQIYNGALDNASGVAGLIELAGAFARLKPAPRRTLLFLATTGEEAGLLGARYYTENPLYPLAETAADINIDELNPWGRTGDITVIGLGDSTLDDELRAAAREQGRVLEPDSEPEKGFRYRSDQFEFERHGVPSLYTDCGTQFLGKAAEYSRQRRNEYANRDYHQVTDEVKPDWDLGGAVEDLRLLFLAGYRVAQEAKMPEWKAGAEFRTSR